MRALLRAVAVLSAIVAVPSTGWADCVSLSQTPAQRFEDNKLSFVADVLGVDAALEPESFKWRVRFRVLEPFKGIDRGEQVLLFRTTAEDFKFEIGTRVLVYAGGPPERLSTSCSGTRVVGPDDPEVQQVRKLASVRK